MAGDPYSGSEAKLDAFINAAVDAIIIADDKGCIEVFSRSAEKIFGYLEEELIGKNLKTIMPPAYKASHDGYIANYRATGQPKIIGLGRLVKAQRKDGSVFPIELSVGEAKTSEGVHYIGIIRDVSERMAAEKEKTALLKKNQAILASIPDLIVELSVDNKVVWANQKALDFFGSSFEGSCFITLFVGNKEVQHHFEAMMIAKTNPINPESIEHWHSDQQGEKRLLVWHSQAIDDDGGNTTGVIVVGRDKTADFQADVDLKKAESEARDHRDKLAHVARLSTLGEMAASIAHEVNQPLTAISTYAQASRRLLSLSDTKTEVISDTLQKISDQAQRAGDIIHRMRKFVKYKSSMMERVDVNELIAEVLRLMEPDINSNNIELEHRLFQHLVFVSVDPVQIQQVVLNLIRNAIESIDSIASDTSTDSSNSRKIILQAQVTSVSDIEISVTDSGIGVEEGLTGELFNPFFTTKSTGLGMGLSICQSIIVAHRGELKYCPNPTGGAIFYFTLPLALEVNESEVEDV